MTVSMQQIKCIKRNCVTALRYVNLIHRYHHDYYYYYIRLTASFP